MTITILDIESTYRKLFNAPDAEARAALFEREIAMPFSSLAQRFGGPGAFAQWGMSPEQFAGGSSAPQAKPFATLVQAGAWHKAARAVEDARAAFEKHADLSVVGDITFALLLTQPQTYGGIDIGYAGFGAIPGAVMVTYSRPTRGERQGGAGRDGPRDAPSVRRLAVRPSARSSHRWHPIWSTKGWRSRSARRCTARTKSARGSPSSI
ncbi:MAG: hypothetical protein HND48_21155 [Chloroflexi bacterium]|nr:hypothetical protein [Chloroflexota bacterium]